MLAKIYQKQLDRFHENTAPCQIRVLLFKIATQNDPTPQTELVRRSQLKKYLLKTKPSWAKYVQFPPKLLEVVEKERQKSIETKQNFVAKYEWVKTILQWTHTTYPNFPKIVAYLQLTSGRRISEVMQSTFHVITPQVVGCYDLHKKQTRKLCTFTLYNTDAYSWMELVKFVQAPEHYSLVNSVNKRVNNLLKRQFGETMSSHKLRGMYAHLLYKKVGQNQGLVGFIKRALCLDTLDVAIHYSTYRFV